MLELDDGVFQVRSTGGDAQLGGDDMDRAVAHWILDVAGITDPSPETVRAALDAARAAKHALTDADTTDLIVTFAGASHTLTLTRAHFDALVRPVVERTGPACRRALKDAKLRAGDLDGVILVGGSTRVPLVRAYVQELFGKEPLSDLDPDQVGAYGAALQADLLAGESPEHDALIHDVIPLSLGIETMGGVAEKILPRNTTIPAARAQQFTTYADRQTGFELHVVQGERELAGDNRSLARFTLKGIPPMPAGAARLEVTFRVDADGLLTVTAREENTGVTQEVAVTPSFGLTPDDVERMLLDSYEHAEDDLRARQLRERTVEGEQVLQATRTALDIDGDVLDEDELAQVHGALAALQKALGDKDSRAIHHRIEALDRATQPLAERRMNRAVARAMAGHDLGEFESLVKDRPEHPHLAAMAAQETR